ncbi:MAG: uL15m family ribosomal protein [archaeon]
MKLVRRRKSGRYRGAASTARRGKKNRTRASGSQGGVGMAGTGKRGDQKKTLVIKLTGGNNYFGKDRTLRRGNPKVKLDIINLSEIETKYASKKEADLTGYKILGEGELKSKLKIKASAASASAQEKIESSGSTLELLENTSDKEKGKAQSKADLKKEDKKPAN